jgi:hypothetical protein
MDPERSATQRQELMPLVRWVLGEDQPEQASSGNVVQLKQSIA